MLDPLEVKTIVLNHGETNAALVVADLFYVSSNLSIVVRKLFSDKTGIPDDGVFARFQHRASQSSLDDGYHLYPVSG